MLNIRPEYISTKYSIQPGKLVVSVHLQKYRYIVLVELYRYRCSRGVLSTVGCTRC